MRVEPTTLPLTSSWEPLACRWRTSCPSPVMTPVYTTPTMTVNNRIERSPTRRVRVLEEMIMMGSDQKPGMRRTSRSISQMPMNGATTPPRP